MRVWTWEFDYESGLAPFTRLLRDGEDSRVYVKTFREATDRELAQFVVDALNAAEQDDATRITGQRLIDATQALIDEKERLLADINTELAEAVRRTEG